MPDDSRVNVSPLQLRQPHLADTVAAALAATGVQPGRVVIELTETQPVAADGHDTWQAIDLGCRRGQGYLFGHPMPLIEGG
jgi:EAL domain-containing protein (putative c-di-GMP-specific phosphodiesterase class I)